MSTKSAHWAKWPSQWLKTAPNASFLEAEGALLKMEIGSPSEREQTPSVREERAPGAILSFQDFVERPLRSTSQRHEDESRRRPDGEAVGDGGTGDGSSLAGNQP